MPPSFIPHSRMRSFSPWFCVQLALTYTQAHYADTPCAATHTHRHTHIHTNARPRSCLFGFVGSLFSCLNSNSFFSFFRKWIEYNKAPKELLLVCGGIAHDMFQAFEKGKNIVIDFFFLFILFEELRPLTLANYLLHRWVYFVTFQSL